ncbi:MAG TPA: hypothetical protein VFP55_11205 [Solirubrobacteraceae bacterium]|nr:hypothetical protein [Solirubrobacteraceae bacterium]
MTDDQRTLKQLILEGMYVVDERSVAGAIVARASARTAVARTSFRSDPPRGEPLRPTFGSYPAAGTFHLGSRDQHESGSGTRRAAGPPT